MVIFYTYGYFKFIEFLFGKIVFSFFLCIYLQIFSNLLVRQLFYWFYSMWNKSSDAFVFHKAFIE